jgi:hypothetical protein
MIRLIFASASAQQAGAPFTNSASARESARRTTFSASAE